MDPVGTGDGHFGIVSGLLRSVDHQSCTFKKLRINYAIILAMTDRKASDRGAALILSGILCLSGNKKAEPKLRFSNAHIRIINSLVFARMCS